MSLFIWYQHLIPQLPGIINYALLQITSKINTFCPHSDAGNDVLRKHSSVREKFIVRQQYPKDKQTNRDIRNFIIHLLY